MKFSFNRIIDWFFINHQVKSKTCENLIWIFSAPKYSSDLNPCQVYLKFLINIYLVRLDRKEPYRVLVYTIDLKLLRAYTNKK